MDLDLITKGKKISDNEAEILKYLLKNLDNLEGIPLKTISQQVFTSPATIVRLAQKLGFSGYLELFYYLKNQFKSVSQTAEDSIDYKINTEKIQSSINQMTEIYSTHKDQFITIYANGFSSIVAEYLQKKLLVNGIKALLVNATDSSGIIANNTKNISMLISITKSGETQKVVEKMAFCTEQQIPNILFTGNLHSRAAELATITFEVADERPLDTQNIKSNSFFGKLMLLLEYITEEFVAKAE